MGLVKNFNFSQSLPLLAAFLKSKVPGKELEPDTALKGIRIYSNCLGFLVQSQQLAVFIAVQLNYTVYSITTIQFQPEVLSL